MADRQLLQFFEGSEKKVEIAIRPDGPSLRQLGEKHWRRVVEVAGASALSHIPGDRCDAYLLSESSLFVFDHRAVMITCGRTTLVHAILEMLDLLPEDKIQLLIYERKHELFPEYQPANFFDDVRRLRERIPGRAYRFGDEDDHHIFVFHLDRDYTPDPNDVTLEILMHGIDRTAREIFGSGPGHRLETIHENTPVRDIFPGFQADDRIFEPVGYSLNAIRGSSYYTIHVTPQKLGSYVSFETNHVEDGGPEATVRRVLEIFHPGACDIVLFEPPGTRLPIRCGYTLKRQAAQTLRCGYRVNFLHYYRSEEGVQPAVELEI